MFTSASLGFAKLTAVQVGQLEKHYKLLIRWNKVLNLTSVRKPEEIIERHYCESLFLGLHLPPGVLQIADVGSGAGFPGVPVAILRPESKVTLIDSHQRKSVFLRESTRELPNVRVLAQRIEDVEEQFDWAILRAVRYSAVEQPLRTVAKRVAFLGGADRPSEKCFTWNTPIQLPWGRQRFLWCST
jgi:16S rRNA (guanine527-N7)-methyltransferase